MKDYLIMKEIWRMVLRRRSRMETSEPNFVLESILHGMFSEPKDQSQIQYDPVTDPLF